MVSPTEAEELNTELEDQNTEDSSTSDEDIENAEESSHSETSEDETSTFDLVKQAIGEGDEDEDDTEGSSVDDEDKSDDPDKSSKDDEDGKEDSSEPSEEELKAWKPKTRKRFQDLQALHRTAVEENSTLKQRLEEVEVKAGQFEQFTSFLEENRLSDDEANTLFNIGAMMKNDPSGALNAIQPYYDALLQMTGSVLPPDLQQQVEQGYITKQHASELSRLRATNQTQQSIAQESQLHQQQQQQVQQSKNIGLMQNAIADWEKQWSTSDPDYNIKKERVLDRVELMLARASKDGNLPQTVEQAIELANKAKTDVEAGIKQFKPKKQVKTVEGAGSNTSMPEPKDTRDVIRRALND